MQEEQTSILKPYSAELINLIIDEIQSYESGEIRLSDKVVFSQKNIIQQIITHQNGGFLTSLAAGQKDDREFFDIITPMAETGVVNIDLDENNLEAYTDNVNHLAQEYFAKSIFKNYLRQTNQGIAINEAEYQFIDDGNIIVRKLETERAINSGEIWRAVLPQNLYVIDQTARTLEDTTVIEKSPMNQTEVRSMKTWDNTQDIFEMCPMGDYARIPLFDIYYRYGEISKEKLGRIKEEVHNIPYQHQEGDENIYIQSVAIMVKVRPDIRYYYADNTNINGIITFIEELKPRKVKITSSLELTLFKPYLSARLGKYNGRFWGEGYREIGIPYQNKANELGNKIQKLIRQFKLIWTSSDSNIAGKNVLSGLKDGQILQADDLRLLNNVLPDLTFLANEWNRNITDCEKALKAFETASGETLPSTASATAVVVQDRQVGKYYGFKRQRFGLLLSQIYKLWVLPDLLKNTKPEEALELIGDATFFEEMVDAYVNGWIIGNYLKVLALEISKNPTGIQLPTSDTIEQIKEVKKQEILSQPKLFGKVFEDFFKDVEAYVGIDFTGETYNKQGFISNSLQLLQYELNPALQASPEAQDTLRAIKTKLGLPVKRRTKPTQMPAMPITTAMPQTNNQPIQNNQATANNPAIAGGGGNML